MNAKAETSEDLQGRRKRLHVGMCKLVREDIALQAEQTLRDQASAHMPKGPRVQQICSRLSLRRNMLQTIINSQNMDQLINYHIIQIIMQIIIK